MPRFQKIKDDSPSKSFAEKLFKSNLTGEERQVITLAAKNPNNLVKGEDGKWELNTQMQKEIKSHLISKNESEIAGLKSPDPKRLQELLNQSSKPALNPKGVSKGFKL